MRVRLAGRRWARAEAADPVERVSQSRVATICEADLVAVDARNRLDQVVDRSPGAEEMLAELEAHEADVAARAGVGSRRRPIPPVVPRVLVGAGLQWPVDPTSRGYPACTDLVLALAGCCLVCDRAGTDAYQSARPGERGKKKRTPKPPRGPRLGRLAELHAAL